MVLHLPGVARIPWRFSGCRADEQGECPPSLAADPSASFFRVHGPSRSHWAPCPSGVTAHLRFLPAHVAFARGGDILTVLGIRTWSCLGAVIPAAPFGWTDLSISQLMGFGAACAFWLLRATHLYSPWADVSFSPPCGRRSGIAGSCGSSV